MLFVCLQLCVLFVVLRRLCRFLYLSELLVDPLLVVVQVLRLCAPFRQSGVASLVDLFSPLALLAVVLSLFSVFWRRLLQHYFVLVYCSEVRLWQLQRHNPVCATSCSLVRGGCSGSTAPLFFQQRGLLFVRSSFAPSGLWDTLPLRLAGGLQHHCMVLCHGVIRRFIQHRCVVIDPRVSLSSDFSD